MSNLDTAIRLWREEFCRLEKAYWNKQTHRFSRGELAAVPTFWGMWTPGASGSWIRKEKLPPAYGEPTLPRKVLEQERLVRIQAAIRP